MALAAEAPMSQQVLEEHLHLEKSTVSCLIKHLEQRGWVKRVRDLHDTRIFRLQKSDGRTRDSSMFGKESNRATWGLSAELKPDEQEALACRNPPGWVIRNIAINYYLPSRPATTGANASILSSKTDTYEMPYFSRRYSRSSVI